MKALEILNNFRQNELDFENTPFSVEYFDEAIKEFEALENRNCNNCKKQETLMCPVTSFCGNIEDFSCNRWESKC